MERISLRINQIYELSNEGYKIIDKNLKIISCNKKYAEFNNLEKQQNLIGANCYEYLCSNNCGTDKCSLIQVLSGKKTIESTVKKKSHDNEFKYYYLNIIPFENESNDIIGIAECFTDVTAIKKSVLALKESETQLKKTINTKDKLFSIIAHDLRSPFNNILGFSELLFENLRNIEIAEAEKYISMINSSAQNTLVLLDNLLNWAKSQTGQINFNPKKIILSSIVHEIIELSNPVAVAKGISLVQEQPDEIEVYADEDMLKTVLRNLISNAIKFTKSGGKISVLTKRERSQIEITISDTGVGMNEETINKLFRIETNETTLGTANEKGSGLGLILCKEFVEKLGGNIWVESEEKKGSKFKFTLPLIKSAEK